MMEGSGSWRREQHGEFSMAQKSSEPFYSWKEERIIEMEHEPLSSFLAFSVNSLNGDPSRNLFQDLLSQECAF